LLGNKDFITRGSITQDHALQHFLLASPEQCSISVYNRTTLSYYLLSGAYCPWLWIRYE